jgi:hypothetical protein
MGEHAIGDGATIIRDGDEGEPGEQNKIEFIHLVHRRFDLWHLGFGKPNGFLEQVNDLRPEASIFRGPATGLRNHGHCGSGAFKHCLNLFDCVPWNRATVGNFQVRKIPYTPVHTLPCLPRY